jgi:hypothetical protein
MLHGLNQSRANLTNQSGLVELERTLMNPGKIAGNHIDCIIDEFAVVLFIAQYEPLAISADIDALLCELGGFRQILQILCIAGRLGDFENDSFGHNYFLDSSMF